MKAVPLLLRMKPMKIANTVASKVVCRWRENDAAFFRGLKLGLLNAKSVGCGEADAGKGHLMFSDH